MAPFADGALVRETSSPAVYVMCGGTLVHIPTPDALIHLGYDWPDVQVVADGALNGIPTHELASLSPTPGSMVFAMNHFDQAPQGSDITKWFQRTEIPGLTLPNGNHLVALRGVLRSWSAGVNETDPDISMTLEPAAVNLDMPGLDPSRFFRVGDILESDQNPFWADRSNAATEPDRHVWVATPLIHMEMCGWPPRNVNQTPGDRPVDWVQWSAFDPYWPWDVRNIAPLNDQPVVVQGVLITDEPHLQSTDKSANYRSAAGDWAGVVGVSGKQFLETCPSRWSEIHPFDSVVADTQSQGTDSLIGVAVVARTGALDSNPLTRTLDVTLVCPVPAPSSTAVLTIREYVLADTYLPSIVAGNSAHNGAAIQMLGGNRFRIYVEIQGDQFAGSAGRFAAVYRMSWVEKGKEKDKEKEHKEKEKDKEIEKPPHSGIGPQAEKLLDPRSALSPPGPSPDPRQPEGKARVFIRPEQRP